MAEILEPILQKKRIKKVKPLITSGSNVCDVGCGKDFFFLKSIYRKLNTGIGIDYTLNENKVGFPKITLKNFYIDDTLPVKDSSFDFVTSLASIEHMDKPESVLRECYRILKPSGMLILTTPSKKSKLILELLATLKLVSKKEISEHKHYFDTKELKSVLEGVGFKKVECKTFELRMNILATAIK